MPWVSCWAYNPVLEIWPRQNIEVTTLSKSNTIALAAIQRMHGSLDFEIDMAGYQSYYRSIRIYTNTKADPRGITQVNRTILLSPSTQLQSDKGEPLQAAVAAGLRVSNFLGALLVGADVAAATGLDGVPPPLLFVAAFNFLGFFLSTVLDVVVD